MIYKDICKTIELAPRIVALGFFDGVHLGHQELLRIMQGEATYQGLRPAVFSFSGHPDLYFDTGNFVGYLSSEAERQQLLKQHGADDVFLYPLDAYFASMEALAFLNEWIKEKLGAKAIVVGADYRFGKGAQGDVAFLQDWCQANEIKLYVVPDLQFDQEKVSSTAIRNHIKEGNVLRAHQLLGHPFSCQGVVTKGHELGRKLGFATANISLDDELIKPLPGVYTSLVKVGNERYEAITNYGVNPTVSPDGNKFTVESHIFGEIGDIYGVEISVEFLTFLRPEKKFANATKLQEQVCHDLENAQRFHQSSEMPYCFYEEQGVSVWLCPTSRFVQGACRIQSESVVTPEKAAATALLCRLLETTTKEHPTYSALTKQLEELYGMSLGSSQSRHVANNYVLLSSDCLQRTLKSDDFNLKVEMIRLLETAWLEPHLDASGNVDKNNFNLEKVNLEDEIKARLNDKIGNSIQEALNLIGKNQVHVLPENSTLEAVMALTPERVTAEWVDLQKADSIVISMMGDITQVEKNALKRIAKRLVANRAQFSKLSEPLEIVPFSPSKQGIVTAKAKVSQTTVRQIYSGIKIFTLRQKFAWRILLSLLGADTHSLLFTEIREKRGLAYSVYSFVQVGLGLLWLNAHIDESNLDEVSGLLKEQLNTIKSGAYSDELWQVSIRQLSQQMTSDGDKFGSIFSRIRTSAQGTSLVDLADELSLLASITREEVATIASQMEFVIEYRLVPEGGDHEA